jgi:4-alpha-glucanotransferase
MVDDLLVQLAVKCGIAPVWTDLTGQQQHVSMPTLRAILGAIGFAADSDAAVRNSLSLAEVGMSSFQSRFTTARVGQPVGLPVTMAPGAQVEVELEGGAVRVVTTEPDIDGRLALPAFDTPGYHTARLEDGDFTVATAPERCMTYADLSGGLAGWGLAAQIYSLRTSGDGGIGSFAGVSALGRKAAKLGADCLAISPSHAVFGSEPNHYSPYSPSTRLFYNPLYADPSGILPDAMITDVIASAGLAEDMARLEALSLVDWERATPLRQALLRRLFDTLRDPSSSDHAAPTDCERAIREASPLLRAHAVFEVLHAHHLRRDGGAWHWRDWPADHREAEGPSVEAFAKDHDNEVAYQIFLQWLTGRSYGEAQRACREAGMKVGLIADLAIGMDGAGSHAWSRQSEVLNGLSVGAPPDYYAADGQTWGLTTFSPRGLSLSGFAPFIETLRANLRYAGGIRIDHVMGMSRLWLVPEGASAREGAYVTFPSETLFRLIALESHRHNAIVIGEDLGTLPNGFREYMQQQGVAGLRVLRFEKSEHGYVVPDHWSPDAAALTTTHDLPSTAAWWAGADLEPDLDMEQVDIRDWDRGVFWHALQSQGVAEGDRPQPGDPMPAVDAAIRYVAKSPCSLKLLAIEDALALQVQPNVPGTTTEKPNWRHRLPGLAEKLLDDEATQARLRTLGPPRETIATDGVNNREEVG